MIWRQRLVALEHQAHWHHAVEILRVLKAHNHQAVLAGGCVRDACLGRSPKDLDIATSARPEQIEACFSRTIPVGKAFGTIVVQVGEGSRAVHFEVTTFRRDGPYLDGRHPSHVAFSDMREDALRRDFTVNALFYDPFEQNIFDFVEGLEDLKKGVLRTVGRPEDRFAEDHLRLLRAVRFRAQLGFEIESSTSTAIQKAAGQISHVSIERVFNELKRLLEAEFVIFGLESMQRSGLTAVIWPELERVETSRLRDFLPSPGWTCLYAATVLLGGAGEDGASRLRAWKVPRESLKAVATQIEGLRSLMNPKSTRAQRALVLGSDQFIEILTLARGFLSENLDLVETWIGEYLEVVGSSAELPVPLLRGEDLFKMGVPAGQKMGLLLKAHYELQLEGKIKSKPEALVWLKAQLSKV